jgi:hypothetical protein
MPVFGFGFPRANGSASFWHNSSAAWEDKRVGLFLSRHRDDPKEPESGATRPKAFMDSEVMIAGVNEDKYTGEIASYPFTPDLAGGWPIPLEGITVNGKAIDLSSSSRASANSSGGANSGSATPSSNSSQPRGRISTGSSSISGPAALVQEIYAAIPGAKLVGRENNPRDARYEFPCENTLGIDVRLTIGGREYAMNPRDMVIGTVDDSIRGGGWYNYPTPTNGSCVGAFHAG